MLALVHFIYIHTCLCPLSPTSFSTGIIFLAGMGLLLNLLVAPLVLRTIRFEGTPGTKRRQDEVRIEET